MRKAPKYKGGGSIKGEPKSPVKNTIDRNKYTEILKKPIEGSNDNFVGSDLSSFSPDVLEANGYKYHSGTMGGKDIAYEKNGNVFLYNEQPDATQNKYGLINIGNPNAVNTSIVQAPVRNAPVIDPNRKPLDLSNPNMTLDPNTGTYKNPVTGATINPIIEQYKNGGKIKSKSIKTKGYAFGGDVEDEPQVITPTTAPATNDYSSSIAAVNASKPKKNYSGTAKTAGAVALGVGNQMYDAPQDVVTSERQKEQTENLNTGIDSTAASVTPWYGLAKGVSNIGRSRLKKDKYGNVVGGTNQALDEWFTPSHESYINAYNREGVGGVAKDVFLGGQSTRAISDLLGKGEQTTGFWGKLNKFNGNTAIKNKAAANVKALDQIGLDAEAEAGMAEKQRAWYEQRGKINSALTERDDNIVGMTNGGKVTGPGTGKSDSINAKVRPGSFIVPVENVPVVEEIKEKVLRKAPSTKANLKQAGGKDVKLSDGEVILTPEEKAEIEMYGYDVDALAPNSDDNISFKDGGKVKTKSERDKIKAEEDALLKARRDKANQNKVSDINKGTLKREDEVSRELIRADKQLKLLEKEYEDYNNRTSSGKKLIGETDERIRANKKAMLNKIDEANQIRDNANKEYRQVSGKSSPDADTNTSNVEQNLNSGRKAKGLDNLSLLEDNTVQDLTTTKPAASNTTSRRAPTIKTTSDTLDPVTVNEIPLEGSQPGLYGERTTDEIARMSHNPVNTVDKPLASQYDTASTINGVDPNQAAYDRDMAAIDASGDPTNTGRKGFDWEGGLNSAINYGLPLAQTAIGLRQLKKLGKRPVDQIDPEFLSALSKQKGLVTQAEDQAKYGLTGAEKTALSNENAALTSAGRFAARNYSGGSPAIALNTERAVINDAYGRGLSSRISDNALKMQKQQMAYQRQQDLANMASHSEELNRRLFVDTLTGWKENQTSAGNLVSAGLSNALDARRYDQFLKNYKNTQIQ